MSYKDYSVSQQLVVAGAVFSTVMALLSIKYHDRPIFHKKLEGVPRNSGYPLVGNLPGIIKNGDRVFDYFNDIFEDKDTLTAYSPSAGLPTSIMTIDPRNFDHVFRANFSNYIKGPQFQENLYELLGHGIFASNGARWKYQRKTASHLFNVKNFREQFTDIFVKEIHIIFDHILDKAAKENSVIDFQDMMSRFTLDSFVLLGFGVPVDTLLSKEPVPFATSFTFLQHTGVERFIDPFARIRESFDNVFAAKQNRVAYHANVINSFAQNVIDKKRKEIAEGKASQKDLLSRFMNSENEKGEKLSNEELRDSVLNFIIAGRDTTAQTVSWLFYSISQYPNVEKNMLEEIKRYITDDIEKDTDALYEVVSKMTYIHAVFYETLRLYPAVPFNPKYTLEDDIWPDGTHVKAGTLIDLLPYAQGRSVKIWGKDAKEFIPERWIDAEGKLKKESSAKWNAFSSGPRVCIGQSLATLEAIICISMLLKRYSFKLAKDQKVTYDVAITLSIKNGLKMLVEKR